MEEKSYVEFRLTVPDLSTPERIQDGRHARVKTHISKGSSGVEKMKEKSSVEFCLTVPDLSILSESKMAATPGLKRPFLLRFSNFFFPFPVKKGCPGRIPHRISCFSKGGGATARNRKCVISGSEPQQVGCLFPCFQRC